MFLIKDAFATVWEWEDKGNFTKVKLGTSEKNKKTGEYDNSNWFATFVGNAHGKISDVNEKDRIKILSGKIDNKYNKEAQKSYLNVVVFDFEPAEAKKTSSIKKSSSKSSSKKNSKLEDMEEIDDSEMPF